MAAFSARFLALAALVAVLSTCCSANGSGKNGNRARNRVANYATAPPTETSSTQRSLITTSGSCNLLDKAAYLGCFDLARLEGLDLKDGKGRE